MCKLQKMCRLHEFGTFLPSVMTRNVYQEGFLMSGRTIKAWCHLDSSEVMVTQVMMQAELPIIVSSLEVLQEWTVTDKELQNFFFFWFLTGQFIICPTGAAEWFSYWTVVLLSLLAPVEEHISYQPDSRLSVLSLLHHRDYFKDHETTNILERFVWNCRWTIAWIFPSSEWVAFLWWMHMLNASNCYDRNIIMW